jgi:S-formylglutathione hydrolase FrmB
MSLKQTKVVVCVLLLLSAVFSVEAAALQGTLVTPVTFVGPVTNRSISFSLYLPPGYAGGSTRYPVVYHLHGMGGAHNNSNQLTTVAQGHEDAVAAGRMEPAIIVFPDGATDSFWADSRDGTRRIETHVVREILPYVDATYRTRADRGQRAIQGFSMGGFGASKFASKFPDLFCVSVVYDGALVTWAVMQQFHPAVAASMFGNDEAYFDQYSPWHWVPQNADTLRTSVPFRQVVGTQVGANQNFRTLLLSHALESEYLETGCAHTLNCVMASGGADSWSFIAASFGNTTPSPSPTPTPTPTSTQQATFVSIGAEDGWALEAAETSNTGGTAQASWVGVSGLVAGDDSGDRQYKAIVSFDTSSLPDGATIVSATLRLKRGTVSGTNPFTTHGGCPVDIRTGSFGSNSALEPGDFAAPATSVQVGTLGTAGANGDWSEATLNPAGRSAIHKSGRTQLRISFATGDNDDLAADFMGWYPGENATSSNRPQLVVVYQ